MTSLDRHSQEQRPHLNHIITFFYSHHLHYNPWKTIWVFLKTYPKPWQCQAYCPRTHTKATHMHRGRGFEFCSPLAQAPSPLCCIPRKMIKWSLDTHLSFVVLRFSASAQCVWLCVPNLEGRRIICCNCPSAGTLLTDRYPRYGSWTV